MNGISKRWVRILGMIRSEFFWTLTSSRQRYHFNRLLYDRDSRYFPGGLFFEQQLFDWEKKVIENDFPKHGTILIGGAGGGREVKALLQMNYRVIATEPAPKLFSALQSFEGPNLKVGRASYSDWNDKAFMEGEKINGVILGWGSFSYVLSESERLDLLKSVRSIAPSAPLLVSFLSPERVPPGRLERLRFRVNDTFTMTHGFLHLVSPEEMKDLASKAGYFVKKGNLIPYPHALLIPKR